MAEATCISLKPIINNKLPKMSQKYGHLKMSVDSIVSLW